MNKTKVAKGKLNALISFSKVVGMMLQNTAKEGEPDGADMFMPATIFTLLHLKKEQSHNIMSNLDYIRSFRHQCRLEGQDSYYLTHAISSVQFIGELKDSDLLIDKEEYLLLYQKAESTLNSIEE
eukprot:CAMPEP_0170555400 /NCGR_PEP_ID=MMETSP0211-20121228/13296_1 /TAXON_ID=311385 /ORGANISM="Pseudokeronopsis sp., Strain OXSARD2" /LENGTH=124 /DNA_ID=CAMNT_0010865207 /DNA_START=250 /DNA_END=624 /DNA_ORIENTATION=+